MASSLLTYATQLFAIRVFNRQNGTACVPNSTLMLCVLKRSIPPPRCGLVLILGAVLGKKS